MSYRQRGTTYPTSNYDHLVSRSPPVFTLLPKIALRSGDEADGKLVVYGVDESGEWH